LRREVSPVSMTRRLERLEGRIRPAPDPDDERAREELNRRLEELLQDHRARRLGAAVVRCAGQAD